MILVVDLAAKYSALVLRDEVSGEVYYQTDSINKTHLEFADEIQQLGNPSDVSLIVFEDVPYGISSQAMVKPVLRYQGVMIDVLRDHLDKVFFMSPSRWMSDFPGVQRAPKGMSKKDSDVYRIEQAAKHALALGYEPPNLVQQYIDAQPEGARILKKHTNPLEKSMTDYVSAFLMSEFIRRRPKEDFVMLQGVSPAYI